MSSDCLCHFLFYPPQSLISLSLSLSRSHAMFFSLITGEGKSLDENRGLSRKSIAPLIGKAREKARRQLKERRKNIFARIRPVPSWSSTFCSLAVAVVSPTYHVYRSFTIPYAATDWIACGCIATATFIMFNIYFIVFVEWTPKPIDAGRKRAERVNQIVRQPLERKLSHIWLPFLPLTNGQNLELWLKLQVSGDDVRRETGSDQLSSVHSSSSY